MVKEFKLNMKRTKMVNARRKDLVQFVKIEDNQFVPKRVVNVEKIMRSVNFVGTLKIK